MKNLAFLALFGLMGLTVACDGGYERENEIEREEVFEESEEQVNEAGENMEDAGEELGIGE